jgi:ABC-2 type transport system ATP-binding protein
MICTNHLSKRFGKVRALHGVSLTVEEGSATALIGANGAGKSTLIRTLMNLYDPTSGSATVLGVDSRKLSPRELAQIGYVAESQEMPAQFTVGGYVEYLRPFYPTWNRDLETSLLPRLRLPQDRAIGALSHGMRMKMGLLCALPFHPKLLILDEPLSGLDPMSRDDLIESLLSNAEDVTILISSQEVNEIEGLATHVAMLDQGKLLLNEPAEALVSRFREVRVTLDREAVLPPWRDAAWVQLQTSGNVLSFVECEFSEQRFEQVKSYFSTARRIEAQTMGLRSIFTTLARTRETGGPA